MSIGAPSTKQKDVVEVHVPITFRPKGGAKRIIAPDGAALPAERVQPNNTLVKALARAFRWRRLLEEGRFATLSDLAAAESINPSYVSRILRLTLLAPDIVEAILDGRQPSRIQLDVLQDRQPVAWSTQRERLLD